MKKRVFCTVTNDLNYDQRMIRICTSLTNAGFSVTLVGRQDRGSLPLADRPYRQHRLKMWTRRGKLFYVEYHFRLFFYLLGRKMDAICAIDLDSILPVLFRLADSAGSRGYTTPMSYFARCRRWCPGLLSTGCGKK